MPLVSSTPHNTTSSLVTEQVTTVAEKPAEVEASSKKPVPMETSTTGWYNGIIDYY
jgi:hypothetical protein